MKYRQKLDLSVDENGMCRIEKISFDAYSVLKTAIENYKKRTGHYPERVLVDQIYRNRENIELFLLLSFDENEPLSEILGY